MEEQGKDTVFNQAATDTGYAGTRLQELELIFNTSIDIIFLLVVEPGNRYKFTSVNQAFLTATGLTHYQVEGKYVEEVVPASSQALVLARYNQALRERQTIQWEETSEYPAGNKTGIVSITPVFNDQGNCTGLVGTVHDISERKKTEQENERVRYLLNERVKELTTLYRASQVLQSDTKPIPLILAEMVALLPPGWQYPHITEARIQLGEHEQATAGFAAGLYKQDVIFHTLDGKTGKIEVAYTRETPAETEGPFLAEERKLIDMLAEMLRLYFDRKAEAEQLLKEKELSESIINSLPGIFYLQEITGEFIRWNKQLELTTGYSTAEIQQLHPLDFFDENDKQVLLKKSDEVYKDGAADLEATVITKDGRRIPYYFTGRLIWYKGRACVIGTGIDITERRLVAEQLLKEKELSESIINSLPGIFYLFDATGKYLRWNKNHETVTGYTTEEMQHMYPLNFFDGDEKQMVREKIEKVFTYGYADLEAGFMRKDGFKIPYFFNGISITYEGKSCLMGVGFDVTERRKAEAQLLKEKELSESIINTLPGIFYIFDAEGNHLLWNKNYETVTGYSHAELAVKKARTLVADDEQELLATRINKAFTEGSADVEATLICKDGSTIAYYFNGIAITYQDKPCLLGVGIDITERKKMEKELRDAEIKFRTLVEKSQVGVYIVQGGVFSYVNPRFAGIFGYTAEELVGQEPVGMIISEAFREISREHVRARVSGEKEAVQYEAVGKRKDGTLNRVEFYGSRAMYEGQPTIIGTMVDITERKQAEEALQKSEANMQSIFDTTDTIYILLDNDLRVMSFNQQAVQFFWKEMNREFKLYDNAVTYFPEERQGLLQQRMQRVLAGEHINYESNYPREDGSVNWYSIRMFPVANNEKKILGMMMAVSDITEKKLLEQEIVNQKVQEQKKITRAVLNAQEKERNKIGQELHDNVNQILAGSKMLLGLMKSKKEVDTDMIDKSIALIDGAINEIRVLTRDQVTPQRKIDLKDLLSSLVDHLNEHTGIKSDFVYDVYDPLITDDLKLNIYRIIQEAVNNVLKHANARQVTIVVQGDKDGLQVVITDDGNGFNASESRTKGIGMANIHNRVESYNGRVLIESSPGNGCRIELNIPL